MSLLLSFFALFLYTGNSIGFTVLARKYDTSTWALTAWRWILLGTLTSLWLIFSIPDSWTFSLTTIVIVTLTMWLSGNIATIANFESVKILPVGICTGLSRLSVIPTFILWYYFGWEILLTTQYIWGVIIILAGILMSPAISWKMIKNDDMTGVWILWIILRIGMHGIWYFCLGYLSRWTDPWFATFIGEFSQAPVIFAMIMSTKKMRGSFIFLISRLKNMFFMCFFAFLATPCFAYAMKIGNIGVATVIISLIGVTTSLYGRFFWWEKLLWRQWLWVFISVIGVFILNIHKIF